VGSRTFTEKASGELKNTSKGFAAELLVKKDLLEKGLFFKAHGKKFFGAQVDLFFESRDRSRNLIFEVKTLKSLEYFEIRVSAWQKKRLDRVVQALSETKTTQLIYAFVDPLGRVKYLSRGDL
jgi:hypothetical protein